MLLVCRRYGKTDPKAQGLDQDRTIFVRCRLGHAATVMELGDWLRTSLLTMPHFSFGEVCVKPG